MEPTKKKVLKYTARYLLIVVLAFLRAISTYVFIVPNAFAPGGVGGLASLIYNIVLKYNAELASTWFNPAVTMYIMNIPLVIMAFIKLNKQYAFNTAFFVTFYAGFMGLFSLVDFPVFRGAGMESSICILAALAGGVIAGISLSGTLLTNSSAGGTDIIGKLSYNHNPDLNIQWHIFAFDGVIVLLSGVIGLIGAKGQEPDVVFVNVASPILYSFISMITCSELSEILTNGVSSSVVFHIITGKAEEIDKLILEKVHRGVTILHAEGGYTHANKDIVICVVRRRQALYLKRFIKEADPEAFVYITKAKEVNGKGFGSSN